MNYIRASIRHDRVGNNIEAHVAQMKTFLLNAAVLTAYGHWQFEGPLPLERAKQLLTDGYISAIGHVAAAQFLSQLLDVEIPTNRRSVQMAPGDRALVLRLKERLPEGAVLTDEQMHSLPFELGLLTRTE